MEVRNNKYGNAISNLLEYMGLFHEELLSYFSSKS